MTRRDVLLKRELKREMGSTEPILEEEIERLNNIINELEKEIKWQRKVCLALSNYGVCVCDILLHKLQELKGSDKE